MGKICHLIAILSMALAGCGKSKIDSTRSGPAGEADPRETEFENSLQDVQISVTPAEESNDAALVEWAVPKDTGLDETLLNYQVWQAPTADIATPDEAAKNGVMVQDFAPSITAVDVTQLTPGATYFFVVFVRLPSGRIAAYKPVEYQAPDGTTKIKDVLAPSPGAVGLLSVPTANITGTSLKLSWVQATDNVSAQAALSYEVVQSASGNITKLKDALANGKVAMSARIGVDSFTVTGLAPATTYFFNVIVKDAAGNKAVYSGTSGTTNVDNAAPNPTITSSATNPTKLATIPISIVFSKVVTGFASGDISVTGGSKSNFSGSGTTYTFDVTPTGDGTISVDVPENVAVDSVGKNNSAASFSLVSDRTPPSVTIASTTSASTSDTPIPVTITFSESVTGFIASDITVVGGTMGGFSGSGTSYSFDLTPTVAGAITIDVATNGAQDAAGNNNVAATQLTRTYIPAPPTEVTGLTASATSSSKVRLSWSGSGTDVNYRISYQSGGTAPASCTSGTTISAGMVAGASTYEVTGLAMGQPYAFRVCALNLADDTTSGVTIVGMPDASTARIFVTSSTHAGDFGGVAGADSICSARATAANLSGVWKAVLCDGTTTARSRLAIQGTILNMNGQVVASNRSGYWGTFTNAIAYDENAVSRSGHVWEGCTATGLQSTTHCTGFTSNSGLGTTSLSTGTSNFSASTANCSGPRYLYCMSQPNIAPLVDFTATAGSVASGDVALSIDFPANTVGYGSVTIRRLTAAAAALSDCSAGTLVATLTSFSDTTITDNTGVAGYYSYEACVFDLNNNRISAKPIFNVKSFGDSHVIFATSTSSNGNLGGIAGADATCNAFATAAGWTENFKAVLSDSNTDARARLAINGPVFNTNSQMIAANRAAFWGPASTFVNFSETRSTPHVSSWTGSSGTGMGLGVKNCDNFTSDSSSLSGNTGRSDLPASFISAGSSTCDIARALYCISQPTLSQPTLAASAGTNAIGDVEISVSFPGDKTDFGSLVIMRDATAVTARTGDCNTGTVVATLTSTNSTTITDSTGAVGYYSYEACLYDSSNRLISSTPITGVKALGQSHQLFVSSSLVTGNIGGIAGADATCSTLATNAGLSGTWKAVISDGSANQARNRLAINGPVYTMNDQKLVNDRTEFWSGTFAFSVSYTESIVAPTSSYTWTGSNTNGSNKNIVPGLLNCDGFTSNSPSSTGGIGRRDTTNGVMSNSSRSCDSTGVILCMSQPSLASTTVTATAGTGATGDVDLTLDFPADTTDYGTVVVTRDTATNVRTGDCSTGTVLASLTTFTDTTITDATGTAGHYSYEVCVFDTDGYRVTSIPLLNVKSMGVSHQAFVTFAAYPADFGGLAAADALCMSTAAAVALPGTWKAILSDGTTSAASRLTIDGPVFNLNSQLVASNAAALWGSSRPASLAYDENLGARAGTVWTGTTASGANAASTCDGWTSISASDTTVGHSNSTIGMLYYYQTAACSTQQRLYCISQ